MNLRTTLISIAALLLAFLTALAQDKPIYKNRKKPEDFWKKTFIAINLTPSLGSTSLGAYISPTFGYHVTNHFNVAAGPLYMFNMFQNASTGVRQTASIWGGRLWAQHRIYQMFYAHAEYEVMNALLLKLDPQTRLPIDYIRNADGSFIHKTIGNPLVGLAYVNEGDNSSQSVTILYNLNHLPNYTPYTTIVDIPIVFRASLNFNLSKD